MHDFGKALKQLRLLNDVVETPPSRMSLRQQLEFIKARFARSVSRENGGRMGSQRTIPVLPPGGAETTPFGRHFVVRGVHPHDYFHGKVRLSRFSCDDLGALMLLMRENGRSSIRDRILFLDTETTGIQGGTGICPFLVGVGFFSNDDFHVVQYFIRDFDEEPSMLYALGELLARFDLIVTYNGAAFDIPLLETRFTLARFENPFERMDHFDLLFTARRLWRNGHGSCRLTALEREIVSFDRGPDVPGSLIPRVYFDFLNGRPNSALPGVFTHNVNDIVSLAALTVCASDRVTADPAPLDDALDIYSLARVLEHSQDWRRSMQLYEMALGGGLPGVIRLKAMEQLAILSRRNGDHEKAAGICMKLMQEPDFSMAGYEGAAIYYEKIERNFEAACSIVGEALRRLEESPARSRWKRLLEHRWERLQQRLISFQVDL
jgi:uncharacterized protein YprB with RNaseH-like and TPR domain